MSLSERIQQETVQATKARDKVRLSALRLLRSALHNREIDKRAPLSDEEVIEVLSSVVKRHKESIEQFRLGRRVDLVQKEEAQLQVVLSFLPEQMDEEEIKGELRSVILELGANGPKDLGSVMKTAMARLKGKVEGRVVQQLARELLSSQGV